MDFTIKINAAIDGLISSLKQAQGDLSGLVDKASTPITITATADTSGVKSAIDGVSSDGVSPIVAPVTANTQPAKDTMNAELPKAGEEAGKSAGAKFGELFSGIAKNALSFASGALLANGVAGALGGITSFVGNAIDGAKKAERLAAQTASVLKSTEGVAGVTGEQVKKLAGDMSKLTGTTGGAITAGANFLLTFKDIRNGVGEGNDIFNQATQTANDMARALDKSGEAEIDLTGASLQLGKALNDPTAGVAALARVGVTFTDQQKKQIATMQESGNMMGAQKLILAELKSEFGGSAEAFGNTTAGMAARAKASVGGIAKVLAELILPVLGFVAQLQIVVFRGIGDALKAIIGFFKDNADSLKAALIGVVASIAVVSAVMYGSLIPALIETGVGFVTMGVEAAIAWAAAALPVIALVAAIAAVGAAIFLLYDNFEGFRKVVDNVWNIAKVAFGGIWEAIKSLAEIAYELGSVWMQFIILPFQLGYEVVSTIIGAVVDFAKSLLGVTDSAEEGGGAVEFLMGMFEKLQVFLGIVIASVKAVQAGITVFAETAKNVIDKVLSLDFSGAVDAATEGGKKIGEATAGAFNEKLGEVKSEQAAKKFEKDMADAKDGIANTLKDGLEIKTKIGAISNIGELETSLENAQAKMKPLQLKIDSGQDLTEKERESYAQLQTKIAETSKKIADVAPDAVSSIKTTVSANGELIQSYEINKTKLGEVAEQSKKAFGEETQKEQKKFGDNLGNLANLYEAQKAKLKDIAAAIQTANQKGDTAGAAKLTEQFKALSAEANKTGKEVTKGFEDGAKAGLLTDEAAIKVGASLGKSATEAVNLAHEIARVAAETQKASIDAAALGDLYAKAAENNANAIKDSAKASEGVAFAAIQFRKEYAAANKKLTADEVKEAQDAALAKFTANAKSAVPITSLKEANELIANAAKESLKEQLKANDEAKVIERVKRTSDINEINKEQQKAAQNRLAKIQDAIESERAANEKLARAKVQNESELAIQLLDINEEANQKKLYAQIQSQEALLALKKKDPKFSEADAAKEAAAINKLNTDSLKAWEDNEVKKADVRGKALVKEFEDNKKSIDERIANESDAAKLILDLSASLRAENTTRGFLNLANISKARFDQLKADNEKELNAVVNKNIDVLAAEESLKAALMSGDEERIEAQRKLYEQSVKDAMNTDIFINTQKKTNFALAELQKQNALDLQLFNAKLTEDDAKREREIREIEIQKTLDAELIAAQGNERLIADAHAMANIAKYSSDEEYARKTTDLNIRTAQTIKDLGISIATGLKDMYGNTFADLNKKFDDFAAAIQKKLTPDNPEDKKKAEEEIAKLKKDLAKKEISYADYQKKIGELSRDGGQETATATERANLAIGKSFQALAKQGDESARRSLERMQKDAESGEQTAKSFSENSAGVLTGMAETIRGVLGQMAAAGTLTLKSAGKAAAAIALDTAGNVILAQAPAIFAYAMASPLGLVGGAIAATLGIAALEGMLALAKAAIVGGGFFEGGYTGDGNVHETAGIVHKGEVVFESGITRGNKDELLNLRALLQGGMKLDEIMKPSLSSSFIDVSGILQSPVVTNYSANEKLVINNTVSANATKNNNDITVLQTSLRNIEQSLNNAKIIEKKSHHTSSVKLSVTENRRYKVSEEKQALRLERARL